MKKFVCLALLVAIVFGCNKTESTADLALKSVISNYDPVAAPFLVFQVSSGGEAKAVALRNSDIYYELRDSLGLRKEDYVEVLFSHITRKKPIMVSESTLQYLTPFMVDESAKVDSIMAKGKTYFLNHYFDDMTLLKQKVDRVEYRYLIKVLFDRGIYVTIADFNGILALYVEY